MNTNKLIDWLKTYPRLTKGPLTKEFESKWSSWLGCKYSVFVNSGSSANLLMLYVLQLSNKLKNKKICVPGLYRREKTRKYRYCKYVFSKGTTK